MYDSNGTESFVQIGSVRPSLALFKSLEATLILSKFTEDFRISFPTYLHPGKP